MSPPAPVVIVGAGHGGFTVADTLRQLGHTAPITLLDAHPGWPYQRPPLSKSYLNLAQHAAPVDFRTADFYRANNIDYRAADPCVSIDRAGASVLTAGGHRVSYGHLVLATGAEPHRLPIPGHDLAGVCRLHTRTEADHLLANLSGARHAVIIGGGFIGLEVATAARSLGMDVTVVEAAPRLMQRSVSAPVSHHVLEYHRSTGVTVLLGSAVTALHGEAGRVRAVELGDGRVIRADVAIIGVGVRPKTELAIGAGLAVDGGIVVDEFLQTSDPAISAVGDCAAFPHPDHGGRVRLESVQNATDQARCVAARLAGDARPYRDPPWFWSHQGAMKVQIVGLRIGAHHQKIHGDVHRGRFSILHFDEPGRLLCGESINSPADHVALRTLIVHRDQIGPILRDRDDISLKQLAKSLRDGQRRLAS
jgi:3-phenylpropionate/trans-cinnamate dioxygenase ferredoxin reductase subunit